MAAVAVVDEGALGLQAGDGLDGRDRSLERVAVIRIAVQGAQIYVTNWPPGARARFLVVATATLQPNS